MKRSLTGLLLVMLTTLLAACGFQLRGTSASHDMALKELDLQARNAYGELVKDVRQMLENNGVRVHTGAPYKLVLTDEGNSKRAASYTSSARGAEYELTSTLEYEIRNSEKLVLQSDRLEVRKVYMHDSNNLTGSDQEVQRLSLEMRRDLVQQLSMRLQHLDAARLAELEKTAQARSEAEAKAAAAAAPHMSSPVLPLLMPAR